MFFLIGLFCSYRSLSKPTMLAHIKIISKELLFPRHCCTSGSGAKKVAIILSGSGVYDGSEIHEASATLVHLSKMKYESQCFAPVMAQADVIDHSQGCQLPETRCVFKESARIARGNIKPLGELNVNDFVACIFPGGFGAAKNLSNFASKAGEMTVNPEVSRLVNEFKDKKKPLGFICIAPIIAAKVIPGVRITLGRDTGKKWPHAEAVKEARNLGADVVPCEVNEVCVCKTHLVFSTPAFMFDGTYAEIFDGIGRLICEMDCHISKASPAN